MLIATNFKEKLQSKNIPIKIAFENYKVENKLEWLGIAGFNEYT